MSKRILIIDDESHIRRMMRLTLEAAGYEIAEAEDGNAGIELYANGTEWDGVVLDQRMAGIDGLETLRQLKSRDANARVVMVTAYASIELAVDAMKLGATDFVRKPMTPETLRNAVAAALAKAPPRVSPATSQPEPPLIQTITMNGFTILDDDDAPAVEENQRRFTVVSPDGRRHDVLVEIDIEVIGYVHRMTNRWLAASNSFWSVQAQELLTDFLWSHGEVPPLRRLVLKNLDPDRLPVAARWTTGN
ncbi:MAG TPA: response regulator [Pyrinomonadaceae bacterium]|jgi:DNA-binding response OmpR family regulator|nr:response regulator [Pyrinomonadaceae bacterium]